MAAMSRAARIGTSKTSVRVAPTERSQVGVNGNQVGESHEHDCRRSAGRRILNRPLPAWRDARVVRLRWTASLRNRTILSRQSVYGLNGYRTYRAYQLRSDYSEIEMDLRSVYEHFADKAWFDTDSAAEVVAILDSALHELEQAGPQRACRR